MDVICNKFTLGEIQVEILGQYSGQIISAPRTEGLSVYQWFVTEKNKQGGLGNTFVNTPLKFHRK